MRDFERKLLENARAFKECDDEEQRLNTEIRNCESRVRQAMVQIIRHQSQGAYNNALSDLTELKHLSERREQVKGQYDQLIAEAKELV